MQEELTDPSQAIDNHRAMLLVLNSYFLSDIEKIRSTFPIPTHLTSSTDAHIGRLLLLDRNNDDLFSGRFTHELLNEENRSRLRKAIMEILEEYELGMNFFTWVQWFILYGEVQTEVIDPDFNFYKRLRESPIELFRLPKTTAQKNKIKRWFRIVHRFPVTGRIPKEHADYYNYFVSVLDRKKPNSRRPRVDHSIDFAVLNQHKKTVSIDGEDVKNTYEVLVSTLTEEASAEEDYKKINTLKKRKERLIRQINKVKS
jgi:hypothetical protein